LVIGVDVGIELVSNISSSGLTLEEEESFLKTYNAELASNRVLLCENEIDKINRYIDPEYPEEWKPPKLEENLRWWQKLKFTIFKILKYSDTECDVVFKSPRLVEKLGWWKQMLEKAKAQNEVNADRLQRENDAAKDNEKTAKKLEDAQPLLEKHSHIGKGRRKHNSLLNNLIDNFDKEFSKNRKDVPTANALAKEMKKVLTNNLETYSFVIEAEDENDSIKWKDDKGNIHSSAWGDPMRCRIYRIRKERKNT
jgi:hypothetical protein